MVSYYRAAPQILYNGKAAIAGSLPLAPKSFTQPQLFGFMLPSQERPKVIFFAETLIIILQIWIWRTLHLLFTKTWCSPDRRLIQHHKTPQDILHHNR